MMLSSTIICLALNIYFEARGESLNAQAAVAYTTLNVAEEKHISTCKAVYSKGKFSWTRNRVKYNGGNSEEEFLYSKKFMSKYSIRELDSWENSIGMAKDVISGNIKNPIGDANYFHDVTIKAPIWSKNITRIAKIGGFIFYYNG